MLFTLRGIVGEPSGKKKLGNKNVFIDDEGNQLFLDSQLQHARNIMGGPLMYSEESTREKVVCQTCVYIYFPKNKAACTYYDKDSVKLYPTEKMAIRRNAIERRRRIAREKKRTEGGASAKVTAPKKRARTPTPTPPPVKRPRVQKKAVEQTRTYATATEVICDVLLGTITDEEAQKIIHSTPALTANMDSESKHMVNTWCGVYNH